MNRLLLIVATVAIGALFLPEAEARGGKGRPSAQRAPRWGASFQNLQKGARDKMRAAGIKGKRALWRMRQDKDRTAPRNTRARGRSAMPAPIRSLLAKSHMPRTKANALYQQMRRDPGQVAFGGVKFAKAAVYSMAKSVYDAPKIMTRKLSYFWRELNRQTDSFMHRALTGEKRTGDIF